MTTDDTSTELSNESTPTPGRWVGGNWVRGHALSQNQSQWTVEKSTSSSKRNPLSGFIIPTKIEYAAYFMFVLVALIMRLYDLGGRAVHHDESLHGYFAYQIFTGLGYDHNPLMHGMFLFHSIATSFFLVGDNEFSLRLPMALFGTGLVLIPIILKPRIGQFGALAASLLLTFSPTLLYYSRFARNDIFMAVFTLALVGAMWRYIDEGRNRWLYISAVLMAVGFATKETQYIVVALLGAFLVIQIWPEIRDWIYARRSLKEFTPAASYLVLLGTLSLPVLAAGVSIFQNMIGITLAAEDGTPGVPTGSPNGAGWTVATGVSITFLIASLAVGWAWKRHIFFLAFGAFTAVFVLLFSNFGSNPSGVATGAWQSLGYWIAQQEVARGDQPWYYYFMIGSVYEFLPFGIAAAAGIFYVFKSDVRTWISCLLIVVGMVILANGSISFQRATVDGVQHDVLTYAGQLALLLVYGAALSATLTLRTGRFNRFLFFWTVGTFIAYTHAGEKMPWLLVNVVLPAIVLAANTLDDIVASVNWNRAWRNKAAFAIAGVPLFYILLWKVLFIELDGGWSLFVFAFTLLSTMGVLILALISLASKINYSQALSIVGLITIGIMFVFTFRAGWIATYENGDIPREMLVYTQTAPDIHNLAKEIEKISELTGDRTEIKIAIDIRDAYSWPWQWYLRRYDQASFDDHSGENVEVDQDRLIAVINENNKVKALTTMPKGFSEGRRIVHRWWFPEKYRNLKPGEFFGTLVDRNKWVGSIDYFLYREMSNPIGSIDSFVFYSEEIPFVPVPPQ